MFNPAVMCSDVQSNPLKCFALKFAENEELLANELLSFASKHANYGPCVLPENIEATFGMSDQEWAMPHFQRKMLADQSIFQVPCIDMTLL